MTITVPDLIARARKAEVFFVQTTVFRAWAEIDRREASELVDRIAEHLTEDSEAVCVKFGRTTDLRGAEYVVFGASPESVGAVRVAWSAEDSR